MKNSESEIRIIDMSEEADREADSKRRIPFHHRMVAKVIAFMLAILLSLTVAVCALGAVLMAGLEMYTTPETVMLKNVFTSIARNDCDEIIPYVLPYTLNEQQKVVADYYEGTSVVAVSFTDAYSGDVLWNWSEPSDVPRNNPVELSFYWYDWDYYWLEDGTMVEEVSNEVNVAMTLTTEYGIPDNYYVAEEIISFAYDMLYWVYAVGALALLGVIACVVFLLCSAGHRKGEKQVRAGWGTKVPFDLLTAVVAGIAVLGVIAVWALLEEMYYEVASLLLVLPIGAVAFALVESAVIGWLMSFAVRIKLGKWWRNTVIFYVLRLLCRFAKFLGRQVMKLLRAVRNIPLIWKTFLSVVGITVLELIIIICCWWEPDNLISFWVVEKLVLIPVVLNCVFTMKKLQKGGEALSTGDLSYQIDTEKMWGDFRSHGEALNSIAEGMTAAVDEQMKSERMKTELITNVSHDIKTPLTSIINYTDLITKESCENRKITEYAEVLMRSSERLKRLIEDLVEASKASTGNLEVVLAPCNTNILLTQAVGEYGDRLRAENLELITAQPEEAVMIMADGRRLWRVFDNLINNVCKYAQEFTRVYLSLERVGDEAVITLKNTSRTALNISADELMERFVRGDQSRNTEGNGLGLSIAKSLTELQNGSLDLSIDGDLFKVTLRFPVLK